MTKILHTADSHIGARQYGLEERRADFSKAFHQVIGIAIEERVSAVIHAGDLFENRNPSAEDLQDVFAALSRLKEAGIRFLGIVGNHERRRNEKLQWLDLFSELGLAVHLSDEPYDLHGTLIYGLDYGGRRPVKPTALKGGVLVAHQLIDKVSPHRELEFEDLISCGAEVILLGDYHEHKVWRDEAHRILITYAGSTERWSLDERARRGCSIIDLETQRLDRRELTTRRFVYIAEDEDPLKGIEAHEVKGAVVCVYLSDSQHSVEEIEEYGRSKGALAVRVIKGGSAHPQEPSEWELDISVEFGDLDLLVSERLDKMLLCETSRKIDAIVRDLERISDSNVDAEVSKILKQSQV